MKRHFFLLSTFVFISNLFCFNYSQAQWVQSSTGMGTDKYASSLIATSSSIIAGTTAGIYRSTNSGTSWTLSSTPIIDVYCLRAIGSTIYLGAQTGLFTSVNDGVTWSPTSINNRIVKSITDNGLNIFLGTDSGVFRSSNGGNNWVRSLNNYFINSLIISNSVIIAGTGHYNDLFTGIFTSTNNGSNWIQSSINNKIVYCLGSNNYGVYAGTIDSGVYISTNNGVNWSITSLNNKQIISISTVGTNVFAGTSSGVYQSTNNGGIWLQINEGLPNSVDVFSLLTTTNYIYAALWSQSIWRRPISQLITGISQINHTVSGCYLISQNYPNPFNPTTSIKFTIPKASSVKITIFDIAGKEVETLVNEEFQSGTYQTKWNGSKYASGIYFYKIQADNYKETKSMILIK